MTKITDELAKYSNSGKYLFHGSPIKTSSLIPSQAYNNLQPDGAPAVFATPFYEIAVFRSLALVAKEKMESKEYMSGFSLDNGQPSFRASQETLDTIRTGVTGFVYVLTKNQFQLHNPMEYRAQSEVKPVRTVEVSSEDLPASILVSH